MVARETREVEEYVLDQQGELVVPATPLEDVNNGAPWNEDGAHFAVDPALHERDRIGAPRMKTMHSSDEHTFASLFWGLLPTRYLAQKLFPAMNAYGRTRPNWKEDVKAFEFKVYLGLVGC